MTPQTPLDPTSNRDIPISQLQTKYPHLYCHLLKLEVHVSFKLLLETITVEPAQL
jgi:hypothetical protein